MDPLSWTVEQIRAWLARVRDELDAARAAAAELEQLELGDEDASERDALLEGFAAFLEDNRVDSRLESLEWFFADDSLGQWPIWVAVALVGLALVVAGLFAVRGILDARLEQWKRSADPRRRLPADPGASTGGPWIAAGVGVVAGVALVAWSQGGLGPRPRKSKAS